MIFVFSKSLIDRLKININIFSIFWESFDKIFILILNNYLVCLRKVISIIVNFKTF